MRCYYCDQPADNKEYLNHKMIWVCYAAQCQQAIYEEKEEQKSRERAYDAWRTRSE